MKVRTVSRAAGKGQRGKKGRQGNGDGSGEILDELLAAVRKGGQGGDLQHLWSDRWVIAEVCAVVVQGSERIGVAIRIDVDIQRLFRDRIDAGPFIRSEERRVGKE